jgi:hypothetical protein
MEHPPHPPIDFSLFGVREWRGAHWVGFFEGEVGKPVWSVTLDHHRPDPALILVKAAPRERWDRVMAGDEPGADVFASDLVRVLLDMARPEFVEESERARYNRSIWPFACAEGSQWESWAPAQWAIEGNPVPARVWPFAHGWTGLTLGDPQHYVGVTAFDVSDTGVDLVAVSGAEYGFEFSVPFSILDLQAQVPERPDTSDIVRSESRHPDHERVLASAGPSES